MQSRSELLVEMLQEQELMSLERELSFPDQVPLSPKQDSRFLGRMMLQK